MKNKLGKKQIIKIVMLSIPVISLVIATLAGLDLEAQNAVQEILTQTLIVVAGALGVTGIVLNNDKNEK